MAYINAGHNPPLLQTGGGDFFFLRSQADLVLAGMEDTVYRRQEITLKAGDTLFLYTDGITEAENSGEQFYGPERLRHFLNARRRLPPRELLPALQSDIEAFSAGAEQSDDITMLALSLAANSAPRSISLCPDPAELEKLLAFIGPELDAAACPEKTRGQIELAAEEIFVNIARYAYPEPEGGGVLTGERAVTVSCRIETGPSPAITLGFTDRGAPFNPLEQAEPDLNLPLEDRKVGGLGILIVKRTMDSIRYDYKEGMNCLIIKKSW
jgi:sigma-B regulation protein RsbU (phosphoserine phosphatase)